MEQRNPFGAAEWRGRSPGSTSRAAPSACSPCSRRFIRRRSFPGLIGNCVIAFGAAAFLFAAGDRLPRGGWSAPSWRLARWAITMAVLWDGHGSSVYSFFYIWVAVEAYYFLTRTQAAVHIAIIAALYAGALVIVDPDPVAIQRWVLAVGVALVAGLLVASMKERIMRLVDRLSGAAARTP